METMRYSDRGPGCENCLANGGCVSPEECMGCDGKVSCNYDYFPELYNPDGSKKNKNQDDLFKGE
jgi:hypothetical protein